MKNGILIISLDFEMMWGCHDWTKDEEYGLTNIKNVSGVIDRLVELFNRYNIHATIASVGMLMCRDTTDLKRFIPDLKPTYADINLSPFKDGFIEHISENNQALYFASDLIEKLKDLECIEIASHTFSHYYCYAKGQDIKQFEEDLKCARDVANENQIDLRSIVFPKNNVNEEYLSVLSKNGFSAYRGNPDKLFRHPKSKIDSLTQRIIRLLDNYIPLTRNTYVLQDINSNDNVLNIKASRFLRPYSKTLRLFEPIRVRRIKSEIKDAAKNKRIYHLWWHPHNFGANMDENFKVLKEILQYYEKCKRKYGMESMTMNEFANFYKLS